ncbi:MAG: GNAT family N-acetyltransferase [Candidatus Sericytochromatia bacterium]|nr:GNAT family N-acetyltransferase [Candidatus Sericytochromatia bacterium]
MIRPAKYKDFAAIKNIFEVAFSDEYKQRGLDIVDRINRWQQLYPVVKLLASFHNPYQHLFNVHVYEDETDNKIGGLIQTSARSKDQTRWHVENIAVLPDHRGKGIAKQLLNYMFDTYMNLGVNRFTLEVDISNDAAIKLYESIGFRKYTTIHYFKIPPKKLADFKKETVSIPEGFRTYKPADAQASFDLYMACTPSSIRIVDQKELSDFHENPIEQVSKYIKEYTKRCNQVHFVVEKDNMIIGSLEIVAQYRKLPHVIRLLVHPGYEHLNETLLQYAFNFLMDYPARSVLVAASEHQKAKLEVIKSMKLKTVSSDYLMVKDNLQIVTLSDTNTESTKSEKMNFKPIFNKKDYAIRKNSR